MLIAEGTSRWAYSSLSDQTVRGGGAFFIKGEDYTVDG